MTANTKNAQAQSSCTPQEPQLSYDIHINPNSSNCKELDFGYFAWQTFVALNWPANSDGSPSTDLIGKAPEAKRVWEFYEYPENVAILIFAFHT